MTDDKELAREKKDELARQDALAVAHIKERLAKATVPPTSKPVSEGGNAQIPPKPGEDK
jgi:hypothetical protein